MKRFAGEASLGERLQPTDFDGLNRAERFVFGKLILRYDVNSWTLSPPPNPPRIGPLVVGSFFINKPRPHPF